MSDARILHKKASGGERVCLLDHLEHRVWVQYVLSADDYGVMRMSVSGLRHDNPRLEQEPLRKVEAALKRVIDVGLIQVFTHQGKQFLWQNDWQDFQGIRYPRATVNPAPPKERIDGEATALTRRLFGEHPQFARKSSVENAEKFPIPAGAGAARNPHPTSNPGSHSASAEESARETTPIAPLPAPIIDGRMLREHGSHAWCSLPREGLCVPPFLHREFVGKRGGAEHEAEVRAWYPTVVAKYAGRPVGEDSLKFWRNEFATWTGSVTTAPLQKRQTAVQTTLATLRGETHG